jgi:DNA-binding transcriptional LysR family regulator
VRNRFDFFDLALITFVAEGRSLTYAAERAKISLSAVSIRIKNLEESLGVKLLLRTPYGVAMTEPGKKFLSHAAKLLKQLEQLHTEMREHVVGARGTLRVCATTSAVAELLPPVLSDFFVKHPEVRVNLVEQRGDLTVGALREGLADVGIIPHTIYSEGLQSLPYCTLRLVLVTGREHPLAGKPSVPFDETLQYEYIGLPENSSYQHLLMAASSTLDNELNVRVRVNSFSALCRMAELNVGIGLLPEAIARRSAETMRLSVVPLTDPWALRRLMVVVRSRESLPGYAQDLVDLLLQSGSASLQAQDGQPAAGDEPAPLAPDA